MSFDQVLTIDTTREHIVFTPFTRPEWQMIFDGATDSVTVQTLDGEPVDTLAPARAAFKGMLRNTDWDAPHLGYFLGYARWNYFTSPFLFTYPGVQAREIESWRERSHPRSGEDLGRVRHRLVAVLLVSSVDMSSVDESRVLEAAPGQHGDAPRQQTQEARGIAAGPVWLFGARRRFQSNGSRAAASAEAP